MATVTVALENLRYRYGSYESVEVVEASGSLCKVRTPNGDEFWVKTAKLKPVRQAKSSEARAKRTVIARAWNPEFELFFAKALESWVHLDYCGSPQYRGAFDDAYFTITDIQLPAVIAGILERRDGGGTSYNITLKDVLKAFVPGEVTITHQHDNFYSISSKEIFFELVRRGLRLGSNHGDKS